MRPSGKFVVRVPSELHRKLQASAVKSGISLNNVCVEALTRAVNGKTDSSEINSENEILRLSSFSHNYVKSQKIPCVGIILFGSAARGEDMPSSDIDLLLVLDRKVSIERELYSKWQKSLYWKEKPVSLQFVSLPKKIQDVGGIWYEVALEGILLWDQAGRIAATLQTLREEMLKGKVKRFLSDGHPYWIKTEAKNAK